MNILRQFLAMLIVLAMASPVAAQEFPSLTGRVVDAAEIIPPDLEVQLNAKLEALETQSQRQLVVVTLPSLQGYDIADYGYQLGREWGLGDAERNDGALLIVAPNERKVRIEIGYGLEGIMTDGLSHLIIQNLIIPRFKEGDMPGGIMAGTDALIAQLQLPDDQARQVAAQAVQRQRDHDDARNQIGTIIFLLMFFFFFLLPIIASMRGGKRYRRRGVGPVIIWPGAFTGGDNSRGSGGFGGGFSGGGGGFGGGFSGGGGSFGGGGASGSW